ncbi:hypothetical protein Q1695_007421 [Nippostrongylus brasiliensis]|nr:hypothetical protein Q1695_007421 [Nippostrongylus brasiliensis]
MFFCFQYVENFFTVLSVVTCVFFLVAFFELREQRCSAVSHVTKNMLERAETMLFRQSCFILCCAMVSVIMRVVIHVVGYDTVDYPTMLYVEKVVNNSTQIAIAVIVMLSTDFRNFVRNRVFRAAGSPYETGLPSVFTKCPSRPIRAPATGCI